MANYLDSAGVLSLWGRVKAWANGTFTTAKIVLTGYSKPSSTGAVAATDTVNAAIGKLEKGLDGKAASSHTHTIANVTNLQTSLDAKAPLASPALTGAPTAPTPDPGTYSTRIATTQFVGNAVSTGLKSNGAVCIKGTIGVGGTVTALPAGHNKGDAYKVISAMSFDGFTAEPGDMIISTETYASARDSDWMILRKGVYRAVAGPATSTDSRVAVFDGSYGTKIKDSGFTLGKSVPSNAVFTDTTYAAVTSGGTAPGLMTGADKAKLDGIATGADKTVVDSSLSATSTNPVENKAVKAALDALNSGISNVGSATDSRFSNVEGRVSALETSAASGLNFKGVLGATEDEDVPASHKKGDCWLIGGAGTYAGAACEVGDMIVCTTAGTAADNAHWTVLQNNLDLHPITNDWINTNCV